MMGLALALVGLYGLVAFVATRRTPEIGIRFGERLSDEVEMVGVVPDIRFVSMSESALPNVYMSADQKDVVATEEELRAIVDGKPSERAVLKDRRGLDEQSRVFISLSPFLLMATSGADGTCDVSPKGDKPGFVRVLDGTRLVLPERNGNKRLDGLTNLLTNPHVGLLFIVPGNDYTLRVNGRAWITRDVELLKSLAAPGVIPRLAVGVEVQQAYFHCVKSFRRSKLWSQNSWPAADTLPSYACTVFQQIKPANDKLEDWEKAIADSDARLYV